MASCKRCLLPHQAPGADLDPHGICAACRAASGVPFDDEARRREREADLEHTLRTCRGDGEYDCLVNLSGGKDSCYLLYKLSSEYGLRVVAFTTDMNVPDIAWKNIRRTIATLGVDHVVHKPDPLFYRKLFRFLLQNQEARGAVRTVCYVCAPLFEGYAIRYAVDHRIPLVVAGYSPGQPEPDRMVYEFPPEMIAHADWTPEDVQRGTDLFTDEERANFWNPTVYPAGTRFPRYLAPFHAWPYSQDQTMKKVVDLGLIANARYASPVHSNCPVNWLLMYSDLTHLGYNPYAPEFSRLIREGKADRRYWRIMFPVLNFMIRHQLLLGRQVRSSLRWLGMTTDELQIRRPAGAVPARPTPLLQVERRSQ